MLIIQFNTIHSFAHSQMVPRIAIQYQYFNLGTQFQVLLFNTYYTGQYDYWCQETKHILYLVWWADSKNDLSFSWLATVFAVL